VDVLDLLVRDYVERALVVTAPVEPTPGRLTAAMLPDVLLGAAVVQPMELSALGPDRTVPPTVSWLPYAWAVKATCGRAAAAAGVAATGAAIPEMAAAARTAVSFLFICRAPVIDALPSIP
jgi:hypothetical protein